MNYAYMLIVSRLAHMPIASQITQTTGQPRGTQRFFFKGFCHNNVGNNFCISLMSEDVPTVEPIDIQQYRKKNSKHEILPKLPARMIAVASSTGGTSVFVQNLRLRIYRGSLARTYIYMCVYVYIYIPSIHEDDMDSSQEIT